MDTQDSMYFTYENSELEVCQLVETVDFTVMDNGFETKTAYIHKSDIPRLIEYLQNCLEGI